MCDANYLPANTLKKEVSYPLIKDAIGQASPGSVSLLGKEPLLYSQIKKLLPFLKEKVPYIYLGTNGYLVSRYASLIVDSVSTVSISIDSHKAEIHDRIRRKNGSFKNALDGIASILRKRGNGIPILSVLCVITEMNYKRLHSLCRLMSDVGIDILRFNFPRFMPDSLIWHKINPGMLYESLGKIMLYPFTIVHGPKNKNHIENYLYGAPQKLSYNCNASNTLSVFPGGQVFLCHDYPYIALGNAKEKKFWKNLNTKHAVLLKRNATFTYCTQCNKYYPSYGPGIKKWETLLKEKFPCACKRLKIH